MKKKRIILYRILLIDIVIVIYIFLTSSIIEYMAVKKTYDDIGDRVIYVGKDIFNIKDKVAEREKELTLNVDKDFSEKLKGRILLQVENNGEVWYVSPDDLKRYYLGSDNNNLVMREFSFEIVEDELNNYLYLEAGFPEEFLGRIFKDPVNKGRLYYINPDDKKAYRLEGSLNTHKTLKEVGLGVSNEDIRKIDVGFLRETFFEKL